MESKTLNALPEQNFIKSLLFSFNEANQSLLYDNEASFISILLICGTIYNSRKKLCLGLQFCKENLSMKIIFIKMYVTK
jgi:hypothetical protein